MRINLPESSSAARGASRLEADARRVVWREIPKRPEVESQEPEPWYDLAARYEEPERWDGMA